MASAADQRIDRCGVRPVGTNDCVIAVLMGAEHRMRIVVLTGQQAVEVGGVGPQVRVLDPVREVGRIVHVVTPGAAGLVVDRWGSGAC